MPKFCEYDGDTNTFSETLREKWVEQFRRGLEGNPYLSPADRHAEASRYTGNTARVIAQAIELAKAGERPVILFRTSGLAEAARRQVDGMAEAAGLGRGAIRRQSVGSPLVGARCILFDETAAKLVLEMYADGRLR